MIMTSDWWSRKLQGEEVPTTRPSAPTGPIPTVRYVPEGNVTATPVRYDANEDQLVTKAKSARMDDRCPECVSGNYFAPTGTQMKRCYDCGYPLVQSGSGGGLPSDSSGPATPAKQTSKGTNFNPNVIVDRIG